MTTRIAVWGMAGLVLLSVIATAAFANFVGVRSDELGAEWVEVYRRPVR